MQLGPGAGVFTFNGLEGACPFHRHPQLTPKHAVEYGLVSCSALLVNLAGHRDTTTTGERPGNGGGEHACTPRLADTSAVALGAARNPSQPGWQQHPPAGQTRAPARCARGTARAARAAAQTPAAALQHPAPPRWRRGCRAVAWSQGSRGWAERCATGSPCIALPGHAARHAGLPS